MVSDSLHAGSISLPATESKPLWRIAGLAALFTAELLVISARTPHIALQNASGLPGLVFSLGTWKVRLLVTLAIITLLVWQSRAKRNLESISVSPIDTRFAWRWLAAHFAAILLFAGLTSVLFENRLQGTAADLLVVGWAAIGAAALV